MKASVSTKFNKKAGCASIWSVKEHDIPKDVWPVAKLRFSSRPEANTDHRRKRSVFQLSCRSSSLSRPTRSRCQMTGVSNERIVLNFSMWTKVTMLKLPVEETKRPISGSTVSMATPCPPQQTASGTPQRHLRHGLPLPQQLADWRRDASW